MIPGQTSKLSTQVVASADKISAKADVLLISGTTMINTITPNFGGGFSGLLLIIPTTGDIGIGVAGNIVGVNLAKMHRVIGLVYVKSINKWFTTNAPVV